MNKYSKEIKILLISIMSIFIIAVLVIKLGGEAPKEVVTTTNTSGGDGSLLVIDHSPQIDTKILIRDFNNKFGPDNARVKLVEFYDPECESCSAFHPVVKEILNIYKGKIQLITRYALYHGNSQLAALASEAAGKQGKFWQYQDALFTKQAEWSHKHEPATSYFLSLAKSMGMNMAKFKKDMEDPKILENLKIDLKDGAQLGINGTPTFYINGKQLKEFSPEGLRQMIDSELK